MVWFQMNYSGECLLFFPPKKINYKLNHTKNWLFRVPFAVPLYALNFSPHLTTSLAPFCMFQRGHRSLPLARKSGETFVALNKGPIFHWNLHILHVCFPKKCQWVDFFDAWVFTCKLPHEFLSDIDLSSFYEYKHIIPKLMFEWWTLKKKAIESILLLVPMSRLWREQIHFLSRYFAFYFSMFGRTSQKWEQPLDHLRFIQGLHARSWFVPSFLFWA